MRVWKKNNDGQSLPRVGKVASKASRIGFWQYEREGDCLKCAIIREYPIHRYAVPPSPMGKAAIRGCRFSRIVKANTGYVEKKNNDG